MTIIQELQVVTNNNSTDINVLVAELIAKYSKIEPDICISPKPNEVFNIYDDWWSKENRR